jgi:hypothetical protein
VKRFEALRIALLGMGAAVLYGEVHDQVTARLCPEYFTVGHADLGMPQVFHSSSPTVLALAWGVVATWWVGLPLGIALALCARAGRWPTLASQELTRPILLLLLAMATCAVLGGALLPPLLRVPDAVPEPARGRFAIDSGAHLAAYLSGAVGAVGLCARTLACRRRLAAAQRERA